MNSQASAEIVKSDGALIISSKLVRISGQVTKSVTVSLRDKCLTDVNAAELTVKCKYKTNLTKCQSKWWFAI